MIPSVSDLVCFSHLRWDFVFQRPNHLMARFARGCRTFFIEEPVVEPSVTAPMMEVEEVEHGPLVCTPHLPPDLESAAQSSVQRALVDELFRRRAIRPGVLWFYTPMAMTFAGHLRAPVVVYDCMDELAGFRGAPPDIMERERALFRRADLVFTGGHSLYRAKRDLHPRVYPFPSSVDARHFGQARRLPEAADQAVIPGPKLGYFGVVDERMDLELIARIADTHRDWHVIMIGPIAKIAADDLPQRTNIHWLGARDYSELPSYLAGWDVALMPFARNDATKFISPTKTLEYLAAGKPIVSTAIDDVVEPYGVGGIVRIADSDGFVDAIEDALREDLQKFRADADGWVARTSWDATWSSMNELIEHTAAARTREPQGGAIPCSTT
jgi:UDP-galactopyranose mutase